MLVTAEQRRAYKTQWSRDRARRNGVLPRPARPFEFDVILAAAVIRIPATGNPDGDLGAAYRLLGVTRRTAAYWRSHGLDAFSADRCCCRLGLHPASVLGPAWFAAAAT